MSDMNELFFVLKVKGVVVMVLNFIDSLMLRGWVFVFWIGLSFSFMYLLLCEIELIYCYRVNVLWF